MELSFYKGKKVLLTGHTGFKGTWLSRMLIDAGAIVIGYSLEPNTNPNLFNLSKIETEMISIIEDIRNYKALDEVFKKYEPEIVFHLAAQPIVRESYNNPVYTYETNVMGTVNILECVRKYSFVKSFLNVTTDKVYENKEWEWGYREDEPLNGFDPYSNSKSCSELVTQSYKKSFFSDGRCSISTARAGNVIGGGDFSKDRIIPDCIKAAVNKETIIVRNPHSTRPYQHVLEPLNAYLMIVEKQYDNNKYSGWYNVGPDECDCVTTGDLVNIFCNKYGEGSKWENHYVDGPHEANFLKLDCSKIKYTFNWKPKWHIDDAIEKTIEWAKVWVEKGNIKDVMQKQILDYLKENNL